tara:strand:- start:860 stop:1294 length:435 start_codon:yes stop_codon:yes gene_type:complete
MQEKLEFFSFLNSIKNNFNLLKTANIPEEFSYADHYGSKYIFNSQEALEKQLKVVGYRQEDIEDLWFGEFEYVDEDEIKDGEDGDEDGEVEYVTPDWEWIESLENKKDHKIELDEYADKEFGIKLNRQNKIDNMIKDFKAQLEA